MSTKRELTTAELEYVQANYRNKTIREMSRTIGISWDTLAKRIGELGLSVEKTDNRWSEAEIETLKRLALAGYGVDKISEHIDRSINSIAIKARKLGIRIYNRSKYSIEDLDYLRRSWGKVRISTMASELHRSVEAVLQQGHKMKLPPLYRSSEDIPLSMFCEATGITRDRVRRLTLSHNFPLKSTKQGRKQLYNFVDFEKILPWMESHQHLFNGANIEEDFFIPEPKWLIHKRKYDKEHPDELHFQIRKKKWTAQEDKQLCDYVKMGLNYEEIGERLNRVPSTVALRARKLGLGYRTKKFWKGHEYKFIRQNYQSMTDEEMAKKLQRTVKAVESARQHLNLYRNQNEALNTDNQKYVKKHWKTKTDKEMADYLGITEFTVLQIRKQLGLSRSKLMAWTDKDIAYIKENYKTQTDSEIAEHLGRSAAAVANRRVILGLKKR